MVGVTDDAENRVKGSSLVLMWCVILQVLDHFVLYIKRKNRTYFAEGDIEDRVKGFRVFSSYQ